MVESIVLAKTAGNGMVVWLCQAIELLCNEFNLTVTMENPGERSTSRTEIGDRARQLWRIARMRVPLRYIMFRFPTSACSDSHTQHPSSWRWKCSTIAVLRRARPTTKLFSAVPFLLGVWQFLIYRWNRHEIPIPAIQISWNLDKERTISIER